MITMFTLIFLTILGYLSASNAEFESILSNSSDENDVLRAILMHNAHMMIKMDQMEDKLTELQETLDAYVKKDELTILVENITQRSSPATEPTRRDNVPFPNVPYEIDSLPTSTEMPVIPAKNMSSMDQMLKLLVRRSCQEWLQSGFTTSGVYTIDADGQGLGEPPLQVYCDMITGYTFLRHDKEGEREATPCAGQGCYRTRVTYSASKAQIRALIQSSNSCHQLIKVQCLESPLQAEGTTLAWWKGTDGVKHEDWAGELYPEHTCACGYTNTCVFPTESCNCDAAIPNVWVSDTGLVTNMSSLPIQELAFGSKDEYTTVKVRYTIGPLRCHGLRSVSYPASCLDLFIQGAHRSGWYVIGEPDSLRFTFCNMESLYQSDAERASVLNEQVELTAPVDVDLADHVLGTLQSRGFTILKQEQHTEILKTEESLKQRIDAINKTFTSSQELTDQKAFQQENKLEAVEDIVKKNLHNLIEHSSYYKTLNFSLTNLEEKVTEINEKIVFYVTTEGKTWTAPVTVKYEMVYLNLGEGYDSITGKFTVPVKGVYYIAFYARKNSNSDTFLYLQKNGIDISKARMKQYSGSSTGTAVIVDLEVNDELEVYLARSNINGAGSGGTSFMGYLLYKT